MKNETTKQESERFRTKNHVLFQKEKKISSSSFGTLHNNLFSEYSNMCS
jgi:hypothetical protein